MASTNLSQRLLWLGSIILAVALLDQFVKQWIVDWIGPSQPTSRVELIGSFLAFEYLENRGAAFGLFQQGTEILAILSVVITAVGIVAMVWFARDEFWIAASIALILGGAIGNAIDRFTRGYVVDYIAVGRFWKFNIADSAVTMGAVLVFILLWRAENTEAHGQSIQERDS